MPISDNILPLLVILSVVLVLLWVFNRLKEGFGGDHASWWYFICSCLFAFSRSLCQFMKGLLTKAPLSFLAIDRYHQNTVFTEYSIYWRAVDHWWRNRIGQCWKLVVNRWHKMTSNQVISQTIKKEVFESQRGKIILCFYSSLIVIFLMSIFHEKPMWTFLTIAHC